MRIWKLNITTIDLWTGARGVEMTWGDRLIISKGFKKL